MRIKTLIISVVVLTAVAAVVAIVRRSSTPKTADSRINQPLVDQSVIEKAAKMRISESGKSVTLTRQPDNSWQVTSYYDFPADFSKLSRFVQDLTGAKLQRLVTTNPERISRLEFKDTKVELLDASEQPLQSITVGKSAESGNGRFVQFGSESKAYLANFSAWLDTEPKSWADTTLVRLKPEEVAKLEVPFSDQTTATFMRAKKEDSWTSSDTPVQQSVNADKVSTLLSSLANLRFSDTLDSTDPKVAEANAHTRQVKLTTFDGKTLTFTFSRKPEEKKLKPPAAKTDEKTGPEILAAISDAAKNGKAPESNPDVASPEYETIPAGPVFIKIASSDPAAPINALMQKRVFQISDHTFTILPAARADLFQPAPPAPSAPTAPQP